VALSDERGHFALEGVPPGARALHVSHSAAGSTTLAIEVRRDRAPAPVVAHLRGRLDAEPSGGDRTRLRSGVALTLRADGDASAIVRVDRVLGAGPRALGILPGDHLVSVDGTLTTSAREAEELLAGPSIVPALLRFRRGETDTFLRVPRERFDAD